MSPIDEAIKQGQRRYQTARNRVRDLLPTSGRENTLNRIRESLEEFGLAETSRRLRSDPAQFGLKGKVAPRASPESKPPAGSSWKRAMPSTWRFPTPLTATARAGG